MIARGLGGARFAFPERAAARRLQSHVLTARPRAPYAHVNALPEPPACLKLSMAELIARASTYDAAGCAVPDLRLVPRLS